MPSKPKTIRAIKPNQGVQAKYKKALKSLVAEMAASVEYWLAAQYKKNPPRVAKLVEQAQDASPSAEIKKYFNKLGTRWILKFNEMSERIAKEFLNKSFSSSDMAFQQALKDAGWAIDFKMTPAMRDAFNASLEENVGLIKSIPEKYLQQVEGAVMRTYSVGGDLESLVRDLKKIYPITSRRAEFIAIDQSNKANAVVTRARQLELGFEKAIWMHSHAGKNPRQDHVASDGKEYNIAEGCLISGEYILPGQLPRCRCSCRVVLPDFKKE